MSCLSSRADPLTPLLSENVEGVTELMVKNNCAQRTPSFAGYPGIQNLTAAQQIAILGRYKGREVVFFENEFYLLSGAMSHDESSLPPCESVLRKLHY